MKKIQVPFCLIQFVMRFADMESQGLGLNERLYEYSFALSRLIKLSPGSLIDIGCTSRINVIVPTMCELGWKVIGTDLREFEYKHPNFSFQQANIHNNSRLRDESADAITIISTLEHVGVSGRYGIKDLDDNGDRKILTEVKRILKSGGMLILTVPYTTDMYHIEHGMRLYDRKRIIELFDADWQIEETVVIIIGKDRTALVRASKK